MGGGHAREPARARAQSPERAERETTHTVTHHLHIQITRIKIVRGSGTALSHLKPYVCGPTL